MSVGQGQNETAAAPATGRAQFGRFAPVFAILGGILGRLPGPVVAAVLLPLRLLPGRVGAAGRYLMWQRLLGAMNGAAYIARNVVLKNPRGLRIGKNFSVHEFCYLDALGGIDIGENVAIAHNCSILSTNHGWADADVPIKYNAVTREKVVIGDDVWLGCGVRIMPGVVIGRRTVVAAGAVVTTDLEGGYLYGGVPAKALRKL